jgi:predicted transcriptional regulator
MESTTLSEDVLRFFKALADANRLKILGLLASDEYTVEELAELLDLRPSTISHHLSRLSEAGLVSAQSSSYYNLYHLDRKALEETARQVLSKESLPALAAEVDLDAYDHKVIKDFSLPDGRLKTIPAQQKKLEAVLRYIGNEFEAGVSYSEKQVNEILAKFHEDTATLRRGLIGAGLLGRRSGGVEYWKPDREGALDLPPANMKDLLTGK